MIRRVNILTALLLAALAPTLVVGFLGGFLPVFVSSVFMVALAHALLLGLPLFLLLRSKSSLSGMKSVVAGFFVGAAGIAVFLWPLRHAGMMTNAWVGSDRVQTVIDGIPTVSGWLEYLSAVSVFGLFGAIGGAAFWAVYRRLCLPAEHPDYVETGSAKRVGLPVFAALAPALLLSLPWALADRSCHNPLSFGRKSLSPEVNIDLDIGWEEWPALAEALESYANERGMFYRSSGVGPRGSFQTAYLSVCDESGVLISVNEMRSMRNRADDPFADFGVGVPVYEAKMGSGWQQTTIALIDRLEARWPGKVRFRDGVGNLVPKPEELSADPP